jgi:hypothetical protein
MSRSSSSESYSSSSESCSPRKPVGAATKLSASPASTLVKHSRATQKKSWPNRCLTWLGRRFSTRTKGAALRQVVHAAKTSPSAAETDANHPTVTCKEENITASSTAADTARPAKKPAHSKTVRQPTIDILPQDDPTSPPTTMYKIDLT